MKIKALSAFYLAGRRVEAGEVLAVHPSTALWLIQCQAAVEIKGKNPP